jgi:hypothetical protein
MKEVRGCTSKEIKLWLSNAQVQLQALYNHCGEAASESACQLQRSLDGLGDEYGLSEDWPHEEIPRLGR